MRGQDYTGEVVWVIADGGVEETTTPLVDGWDVRSVKTPHVEGVSSLANNIRAGIDLLQDIGVDAVVVVEDDDYYFPSHLSTMHERLGSYDISGNDHLRYYHIGARRHRVMRNHGSSLCQTAILWEHVGLLREACDEAEKDDSFCIDGELWRIAKRRGLRRDLYTDPVTVIGIKGLPGRVGYGIGHKVDRMQSWDHDPDGSALRDMIGQDAEIYIRDMEGGWLGDPD